MTLARPPGAVTLYFESLGLRRTSMTGTVLQNSILNRAPGRVIDAYFGSTHSNASIGSAYGLPDTYMRVYYLESGVMERYATISGDAWDQYWVRMWPSLQPDNPGGAVAGLEWGNTDVRVYYMNGGTIHEIALTDGVGWWPSRHID